MTGRSGIALVLIALLAVALSMTGCGSGARPSTRRDDETEASSPGIGMSAPISKVVVARRYKTLSGRLPGAESVGSKGCAKAGRERRDQPLHRRARAALRAGDGAADVLIVNRTEAYHRSEGEAVTVGLGPYRARILPQQAVRFGPVGRFFGRGFHQAIVRRSQRLSVLIEPKGCGIFRAKVSEPLCFRGEARRGSATGGATSGGSTSRRAPGTDLSISVDRHSQLAHGTAYSKLDVTNLSRRSCTVIGVPRVEAVDREGVTVGKAEPVPLLRPHTRGGVERIWLPGGGAAHFTVTHAEGTPSAACRPARAYGLRVTLPGAQRAQTVPLAMPHCRRPPGALDLKVGRIE
jgi:Protein of unknown function (DUF4232)